MEQFYVVRLNQRMGYLNSMGCTQKNIYNKIELMRVEVACRTVNVRTLDDKNAIERQQQEEGRKEGKKKRKNKMLVPFSLLLLSA